MSEAYVECLIQTKKKPAMKILFFVLVAIAILAFFSMLVLGVIGIALTVVAAVGAYFANLYSCVEYEYLYLDKELTVDRVLSQSKRKRIATYALSKMEVIAPIKSYHLDNYKNRQVKEIDYSIGEELKPDLRYTFYYEGGTKVLFSPNEELVKALKNSAPRKVFTD